MKKSILILFTFLMAFSGFAQNIDWANAPMNPIPQGADLKYHNLKGDVMQGSIIHYFTRDGKWLSYDGLQQVKKDAQGRVIQYIEKERITTYQYDSKGNLVASSGSTYEYDSINRLIKANHKYETIQYSYKKDGAVLIVSEKNTYDGKTSETEYHYKNGLKILQKTKNGKSLKYEYEYDNKSNWISMVTLDIETNKPLYNEYSKRPLKPITRSLIYYSDYDKGLSAITVQLKDITEGRVANAPLIAYPLINGKELEKQFIARLIDDYVFYEPMANTYYIARNAFLKTNKVGQKFPVEKLISGKENILLFNGKYIRVVEKGNTGEDADDWKTTNYTEALNSYISVNQKKGSSYAFENVPTVTDGKTVAIVGKSISGSWFATINNRNGVYIFENGVALNLKSVSGYLANSKTKDLIVAVEGGSEYILPDYDNVIDKKFYKARLFNPTTDIIQTQKTTSSNTTQTTTTAGSASANNTAGSANEIAEKPGASFNPQLPLYVKEVSNNVFYFYQNNKRIQDPIYHQTSSLGKNIGIECYYKTDKDYYFYVPGTENPNAEGKYKMYGLRGRYVFTTISKDEQKFVFEGKTLKPQEYDFIVSRAKNNDGGLLLLKDKGLMFHIQSFCFPRKDETVMNSVSNSDALGNNSNIFIVYKENGEMVVVEKGKIQPKTDWKIIMENDKNFLINNVDGRKYRVGIYNLAITGVVEPNFINLVQ